MNETNKLKQEIEEYLTKDYCCEFKKECKDGVRIRCSEYEAKLYLILRFAEPREKRIAELEMTVGTLRTFSNEQAICIKRLKEKLSSSEEYGKEGLQAYLKLEKENKELKSQIENYKLSEIEAKELLQKCLNTYLRDPELRSEVEEFLKEGKSTKGV